MDAPDFFQIRYRSVYDDIYFHPTLANYQQVLLRSDYARYIRDSLIVSGGAVLVSIIVGVPAAYALARYNFARKEELAFQIRSDCL